MSTHLSENWLDYTPAETLRTQQELAMEMDDYPTRILMLTGRKIEQATLTCPRCSGLGGNGWEDVCSACAGDGSTLEWVFESCGHKVEADECEDEACFEACHVQVDLDVECGRLADQVVAEPWTPRAFQIKCCDHCADSMVKNGYKRVLFPESTPLKALWEVESERSAGVEHE